MDLSALFEQCIEIAGDASDCSRVLPGGGGVYALTDEQDRLILLAGGESLRRVVTYRLTPPRDASKKRADLKAVVRRIRWQRTYSPFETAYEFHRIARVLMPESYLKACAFGPAWFVHVNLAEHLPQFVPTKHLEPVGVALGPLPTRNAVERMIEMLEDLFDLCRYYHILQQAPHGQPCAYFEMGKCPAPCNGSIPLEQYRRMMAAALAFGAGGWRTELPRWEGDMRDFAQGQRFEEANRIKQRLQRAELLRGENYRHVRRMEQFDYLVIQRGEGTSHVRPFFVRSGSIERGPSASRKEIAAAAATWIDAMRAGPVADAPIDVALRSEWVWLVSHYLFKGGAAPGLFLGPEEWPQMDEWLPRVNEKVLRARPQAGPALETEPNLAEQQPATD